MDLGVRLLYKVVQYNYNTLLPSKFFPAKFFFCILEKGNLAGKNLLCKGGFSIKVKEHYVRERNRVIFDEFYETFQVRVHFFKGWREGKKHCSLFVISFMYTIYYFNFF